jgi:WhiB family redox-sensing transcriptional regulator
MKMQPKYHKIISATLVEGSKRRGRNIMRYVLQYNSRLFQDAVCQGIDTEVFYPVKELFTLEEELMFKAMCSDCPVMRACLEWGLAHERYGVWGGTTPPMRTKIRHNIGWDLTEPSRQA